MRIGTLRLAGVPAQEVAATCVAGRACVLALQSPVPAVGTHAVMEHHHSARHTVPARRDVVPSPRPWLPGPKRMRASNLQEFQTQCCHPRSPLRPDVNHVLATGL